VLAKRKKRLTSVTLDSVAGFDLGVSDATTTCGRAVQPE
jgi:hypothetical protein